MRKIALALVLFTTSIFPSMSPAAGFNSDDLTVLSLPFSDDLYITGGKIVVTEPVVGDLLVAGGSVIINGPVGADLMAAGGNLIINSAVGDDLRAAGGDITLTSSIGGDVMIYGGSVTIPSGVVVEGDIIVGAGTLHLGGTVRGNMRVDAGTVNFSGVVNGDAKVYAEDQINLNGRIEGDTSFAAPEVVLGQNADFGNNIAYWTKDGEMDFGQTPVGGQAILTPELRQPKSHGSGLRAERAVRRGMAAAFGAFFFGTLLSGILAIILGVLLFKGTFREAGEVLHLNFWKGLGIGILTYLLLPIAAILAIFTLIGIPVGLLFLMLFVFAVIFGRIIAAMAFAAWMERRRVTQWSTGRFILASLGFFILLKLVNIVPFLGWVAVLLATFAGVGAMVVSLVERRQSA